MPATKLNISLLILLGLVAAALAGCGSANSSSQSSNGTEAAVTKPFKEPEEVTQFGKPAAPADVEAASKVLAENLEAREEADFATQCASLDAEAQTQITGATKSAERVSQCPTKLRAAAQPLQKTAEIRRDAFDGSIDELRLEGSKAFALFHGTDGKNYSIPLQQEQGGWKVGSIVTTQIE